MRVYIFIAILLLGYTVSAQNIAFSGSGFKYRLTQANTNNSIAKNSAGQSIKVDMNNDGEIQVSEALNVSELNVDGYSAAVGNNLIGINYFTNLVSLDCHYNSITSLDISNLINLNELDCSSNPITTLTLNPSNHITKLNCGANSLTSIDTSILTHVTELNCAANEMTSLTFGYLPNLTKLDIHNSYLLTTPLNLNSLPNLTELDASNIGISTIDISSLANLKVFGFEGNSATSFDFSNNPNLETVAVRGNLLTEINVSNLTQLQYLYVDDNFLTSLNLSNNPLLFDLFCQNNQLTSIDLSNTHQLYYLYCAHNQLTSLDLSDCSIMHVLNAGFNQLYYLNIKNGSHDYIDIQSNPNLTYICTDEIEANCGNFLYNYGYNYSTYCTFTPGGVFYTVNGSQKYDADTNGCDANDLFYPNLNYAFTSTYFSGNYISDASGNFSIPFLQGVYTIIPSIEHPSYFTISPPSLSVSFPQDASPYNQNFCINPNGNHNDLEILITPLFPARPGFDATYKLIYKNKGTSVLSGAVTFEFEDDKMDLVSTNPVTSSEVSGLLTYNFSNLLPFETRIIDLTFNINSPTESPAVNIGDQLDFTAIINPLSGDEYLADNTSGLKQIVVGSYDPNDKMCVEGNVVGPEMIGQYVHYVIRFENTGTFPAENVVVHDLIDLTKFDLNSLVPTSSSHSFVTRIVNYGKVEFIFENIQLPFDDANNDGYIAFKIKTKPNLVVGNTFTNKANIYFDYNIPIETNTASTTIQALENVDFDFAEYITLYPNPAQNELNIKVKNNISISSISIYNNIGQLVLASTNPGESIDVCNLKTGSYFVKVLTDKGTSNSQFIKE
jgi:Leucine-rich repeat (LRR) protein